MFVNPSLNLNNLSIVDVSPEYTDKTIKKKSRAVYDSGNKPAALPVVVVFGGIYVFMKKIELKK